MAKPLVEHQVRTKELMKHEMENLTIYQNQSGITVTWSFEFANAVCRSSPNDAYFFGYLSHDEVKSLRDFLNEELM